MCQHGKGILTRPVPENGQEVLATSFQKLEDERRTLITQNVVNLALSVLLQ